MTLIARNAVDNNIVPKDMVPKLSQELCIDSFL